MKTSSVQPVRPLRKRRCRTEPDGAGKDICTDQTGQEKISAQIRRGRKRFLHRSDEAEKTSAQMMTERETKTVPHKAPAGTASAAKPAAGRRNI